MVKVSQCSRILRYMKETGGDNFLGSDKGIRLHPFVQQDLRPAPGGMADKRGAGLR